MRGSCWTRCRRRALGRRRRRRRSPRPSKWTRFPLRQCLSESAGGRCRLRIITAAATASPPPTVRAHALLAAAALHTALRSALKLERCTRKLHGFCCISLCLAVPAANERLCRVGTATLVNLGDAVCFAEDDEGAPGQDSSKAAVPFTYNQPGSTGAANQVHADMRAVGFAYGDQAETAGASDGASDAAPDAEAVGTDVPAGVPTVQPQPFVPQFEVPEDLRDCLPETERMHKVRVLVWHCDDRA